MSGEIKCLACGEPIKAFDYAQGDYASWFRAVCDDVGTPIRITQKTNLGDMTGWVHRRCLDKFKEMLRDERTD